MSEPDEHDRDYAEERHDATCELRDIDQGITSAILANRDRAEALPECDWVSDTPETEAAVNASGSLWSFPLRECSRRLERQRNELKALFKKGK